jgi:5-methylthioribose kinase
VPDRVPRVYHYDDTLALTVMELLEPHIIMRKGMIAGIRYPQFADHITTFLAETLFRTSDLGLPAAEKKRRIAVFAGNAALCRITEDLIFTDPYRLAPLNRWTAPHLDAAAAALRADGPAKAAVTELKRLFLSSAEALVHGDLHTGSIMVTPTDTKVIDPEFAFYGPMGFDIGAVIGNLLLSYISQDGHAAAPGERDGYKGWILDQVEAVWTGFDRKFLALWRAGAPGDLVNPDLFADPACIGALESFRVATLARLFAESTGFAAAKMIRRILGLAHVLDLESIADPARRAACEERALTLARDMLVNRSSYVTVKDIVSRAAAVAGESAGAKG